MNEKCPESFTAVQAGPEIGAGTRAQIRQVLAATGEFLLVGLALMIVPLWLFVDLRVIGSPLREASFTEVTQSLLLVLCFALFARRAITLPSQRGFLVLVSGFILCMLIREQDHALDFIYHGFWVIPALAAAGAAMGYALSPGRRETILPPMARYIGSHSYYYLFFGLLMVLVFSRVFGSGSLLWDMVMGDQYNRDIKTVIQEGLELFGYVLMAFSAWYFFRDTRSQEGVQEASERHV
ncbi:MAG: transporter [Alcanivorax sp.]|nr:transporter [Alcanivorax sp.]